MKKQFGLAIASLGVLVLLGACASDNSNDETGASSSTATEETSSSMTESSSSSDTMLSGDYQDGEYRVEAEDFDDKGWKEYVELTIADGKISDVTYNAENEAGELKTDDEEYKENMEKARNTYPEKYMKELTEDLVDKQEPSDVEVVSGATHSSNNFKALATETLKYAEDGETGTHTMELMEE